jgi:hypothetical protein
MSELMDHEILKMVEKDLEYQREKKKKEEHERVPDMRKELHDKNLKIMVKYSNINYDSVEDVLETRRGEKQVNKKAKGMAKDSIKVPEPKVAAPA